MLSIEEIMEEALGLDFDRQLSGAVTIIHFLYNSVSPLPPNIDTPDKAVSTMTFSSNCKIPKNCKVIKEKTKEQKLDWDLTTIMSEDN